MFYNEPIYRTEQNINLPHLLKGLCLEIFDPIFFIKQISWHNPFNDIYSLSYY
jgi:hypothetical protein